MKRIANTKELETELQSIMRYAGTRHPSRARVAQKLASLGRRVALEVLGEYWCCQDCTFALANDDYSGIDDPARVREVKRAVRSNPDLAYDGEEMTFSRSPCDCCGEHLAGSRTKFVELG